MTKELWVIFANRLVRLSVVMLRQQGARTCRLSLGIEAAKLLVFKLHRLRAFVVLGNACWAGRVLLIDVRDILHAYFISIYRGIPARVLADGHRIYQRHARHIIASLCSLGLKI